MPKIYQPPKGCPPALKALIEKLGTKVNAVRALGVAKDTFTRVVNGGEPMPSDWAEKIERAMKGESSETGPVFKPWDGTKRNVTIPARTGRKGKTFKNVPSMLADLLEQHDGNISAASRAAGTTGNTIMAMISGGTEFNEKRQRMVFSGLHGVPLVGGDVEGPDTFKLGIAIVQVPSKNYDRVRDVAALLHGRVLFKTNTPVGWLVVYQIKGEDAKMFKRLSERDCSKITCP
jgi:hypothetical protein